MKSLFKIFICLMICLISQQIFAQTINLKAGLNMSRINGDMDDEMKRPLKPGFHIGASYEWQFNDHLAFEPGLLFSHQGFIMKYEEEGFKEEAKASLNYMQLPLLLKGSFDLGKSSSFFFRAGPYFAIALSGKSTYSLSFEEFNESVTEKISFGEEGGMSRLDYGLSFGAGLGFDRFDAGIYYDLGLANLASDPNAVDMVSNGNLKLSVSYRINQ